MWTFSPKNIKHLEHVKKLENDAILVQIFKFQRYHAILMSREILVAVENVV